MTRLSLGDQVRAVIVTSGVAGLAFLGAVRIGGLTATLFATGICFSGIVVFAPMVWGGRVPESIYTKSAIRTGVSALPAIFGMAAVGGKAWSPTPWVGVILLTCGLLFLLVLGIPSRQMFINYRWPMICAGAASGLIGQWIEIDRPVGWNLVLFALWGVTASATFCSRMEQNLSEAMRQNFNEV